ncbi:hypothetical protein [Actinoplanes sp. NBRC 103695]|uniref:hypothetical protein n=1 Tax=Actinoplanes sp. NBRC 103695 TaxID=3032202 RepID=UPI0024A2F126|nr:hypothetical protein [Actinoplanes sp. NBRC 103695]GLY96556.1 hypothetical protein Acsp02_38110 [Actinoplanes sp. NBRC 103695]
MALLMRDHPSWRSNPSGATRVMREGPSSWLLSWIAGGDTLLVTSVHDQAPHSAAPRTDLITPPAGVVGQLGAVLDQQGAVLRVRNGDLWDAVGTAIIRQVIRAGQAREMYGRFCQAHGPAIATDNGEHHLFPPAETVAGLPAAAFADLGMAFKGPALVAAAAAYLAHGDRWTTLGPAALSEALQQVSRVGPWTAGAAVADHTNDFACYPYGDLAVRTWARRAAPDTVWPDNEPDFAAHWRNACGPDLSDLTLLTLAWGDHHVRAP